MSDGTNPICCMDRYMHMPLCATPPCWVEPEERMRSKRLWHCSPCQASQPAVLRTESLFQDGS
eukprot:557213-Karenia_brevis.AAC.1